jgi:uncharacterized protein YecE (DUF72 family)
MNLCLPRHGKFPFDLADDERPDFARYAGAISPGMRFVEMTILIGTAGWSIGTAAAASFPGEGTGLERYASVFPSLEINSSFHRPHRSSTWQKWRDAVPKHFRFAVKMPKTISHERKLVGCEEPLEQFLEEASELGDKLEILLLQLPPKLAFDESVAASFFETMRSRCATQVVCEPRHASWFDDDADDFLRQAGVARVAADPARHPNASIPGGWRGLSYFRLHGSPVMYRSSYGDRIDALAEQLGAEVDQGRRTWCIFDNTASSAAISDALALQISLRRALSTPSAGLPT